MTNRPDVLEQIVFDRKRYIETFMFVENKERVLVPFHLNHIQEMELAEQSEMKRDIYVKPAQVGSTTLWAAVFLHDTMIYPGTTSVIVAHEEFITQRLLQKVQALYDNMVPQMKVDMHRSSAYEKTFPDINSTFYIGSARAYVFGRGEPIHNFLGSEAAFWPDAPRIMIPTMQRVPLSGTIILESTPNGEEGPGKYFHDTYRSAKESGSIFKHHFYRWWDHDEYQISCDSQYALPEDRGTLYLTEEESDLVSIQGLTEDQIRWRRRKIKEFEQMQETGETRQLFHQEFPEDDVRCWLSVGDQAYDTVRVEELARQCIIAPYSREGAAVWYQPEEQHRYMVSIDPGLGKDSKTVLQAWEFTFDDESHEVAKHCATLSGYFTAERTAALALSLCDYFNHAYLCIETNPPGLPVAYLVQNYRNLYYRTDVVSGRRSRTIGWLTTPRTKPHMVSELHRMLPHMITHDINLVSQFRNMRYVGDRVMAMGPDDHHDAAAIAMVCRQTKRSQVSGFAGTAGWSEQW